MNKSLIKDQRGVGHIVLVLAVVVIAAVGFVGWRVTQKDSVAKNASPAVKAAVSACEKEFKDKDLCKFTGNYDIEKLAYEMVATSDGPDGKSVMTLSSDGKGNTSMSTSGGGQSYESRSVNKVSYLKDTDGSWIKFAASDTSAPKETSPVSDIKIDKKDDGTAKDTLSYKKLGKEKCGKLTCFKYQVVDSSQPGTTTYVWFDDDDYRMQHYYVKDDKGTTDMVITYKSVKIAVPSPVKEFNASAGTDSAAYQQALEQAQAATETSNQE